MNINLDNTVTISVNDNACIERLNIRYVRNNIPQKYVYGNDTNHISPLDRRRKVTLKKDEEKIETGSNISNDTTSSMCEISPTSTMPSRRPSQSYYFGETPLSNIRDKEERKDSAVYKVVAQIQNPTLKIDLIMVIMHIMYYSIDHWL